MPSQNVTLPEVEIFDVGTHNGIPFDEAAVKALFESTKKVIEQVKPYLGWSNVEAPHLGIGHRNKDGTPNIGDELAEKKRSDLPSLGWMTNLRMKGTKIVATFADVPRSVYEAIRLGRYRRVSPDVEFNYRNPVTGERLPAVIKAVRLIGVTPAIKTLADVLSLGDESLTLSLTEAGGSLEQIEMAEEETTMPEKKSPFENVEIKSVEDALGLLMDLLDHTPAAVKKEAGLDTLEFELTHEPEEPEAKAGEKKEEKDEKKPESPEVASLRAELKTKDEKIKTLEQSTGQLRTAVEGIQEEKLAGDRKAAVDRLKKDGYVTPAQEPAVLALMEQLPPGAVLELSEGGKLSKFGGIELVEKILKGGRKLELAEQGRGGENEEGPTLSAQYQAGKKVYESLGIDEATFSKFNGPARSVVGGIAEFGEDAEVLVAAAGLIKLLKGAVK